MTNIAEELRNLAFEARKENSSDRLDRYAKARDEAFEVITDGVMEKIRESAKEGRFRYSMYDWVNQPRDRDGDEQVESDTQVFFGADEDGKNGLHIMALLNPAGIPYEQQLIFKLRQFFNPSEEQQEVEEGRRVHRLKVYLNRRPTNPRQCSLVVSWDRRQPQFNQFNQGQGQQRFQSHSQNGNGEVRSVVRMQSQGRGGYSGVRRTFVGRPRQ